MSTKKGLKNKLFKGLTETDILSWEECKMKFQQGVGKKATDLQFLRHLISLASSENDGVFAGMTEHDILTFEEEKLRFQRRLRKRVTDLEFLRHLLMTSSRPVIRQKEGVVSGFITGSGPIYDKSDTLLEKYRTQKLQASIPDRRVEE